MARLVEVEKLLDSLSCGVCMELLSSACIFPCGHSLCSGCAEECINLKHQCPFCKAPTTMADRIRNHALQAVVDGISEAAVECDARHFESLQTRIIEGDEVDPAFRQHFSPIEGAFADALRTSFVQYQELFRRLKHKQETTTRTAQSLPEPERSVAIMAAQREFDISMQLLQEDCQKYLNATTVSPFLLSSTVTVSCLPRNLHFNMQVDSLTMPSIVIDALRKHLNTKGPNAEFIRFQEPVQLCLVRLTDQETVVLDIDSPRPLGDYLEHGRIDSTWTIVLKSDVVLANDAPSTCFARLFGTPEQPVSLDYFACKDCGINWVCAACAHICHSGHDLRTHVLKHVPTWACCYCYKKHSKSHCRFVQVQTETSEGETKVA